MPTPRRALSIRRALLHAAALGAAALAAPAFAAGEFPSRPVTIVVAFPPGGPADVATRALADELVKTLGQAVVVENRSGASGKIGTVHVANAAPDGYTLTMATGATHGINPLLYKDIGYDPIKDFAPIAWVTTTPNVLVANKDFPARTLADLISYGKERRLNVATAGQGSTQDMSGRLLAREASLKFDMVHYRGSAPARTDVLAGHVPLMFDTVSSAMPFIASGQLRAIAVTSRGPASGLPDVPPVAATLPGFEVSAWYGLLAPARTPPEVVATLNKAVNAALATTVVKARYQAQGAEIVGGPPRRFADHLASEADRWGRLIRETGITLE